MSDILPKRTHLQDVVNRIHEAALDPALWPDVVERARSYCNSDVGFFIWMDLEKHNPVVNHATLPNDALAAYRAEHFYSDPCFLAHSTDEIDNASLNSDWEPRASYLNSDLYRNFLTHVGVEDRASVSVLRDADHYAVFGV